MRVVHKQFLAVIGIFTCALALAQDDTRGREATQTIRFYGHDANVKFARLSPDRSLIASSDGRGRVIVWDAGTGQALRSATTGHEPFALEWSPDGHTLAVGEAGIVRLLDANDLTERVTIRPEGDGNDAKAAVLDWSPDGARLRVETRRQFAVASLWRADGGRVAFQGVSTSDYRVFTAPGVFSPDSRTLYQAISRNLVALDATTGQVRWWIEGEAVRDSKGEFVFGFSPETISPDGRWLVVTMNHTLALVETRAQGIVHIADESYRPDFGLRFSPDSRRIAVATEVPNDPSDLIRVYEVPSWQQVGEVDGNQPITFNADGSELFTRWDDTIMRWSLSSGVELGATKLQSIELYAASSAGEPYRQSRETRLDPEGNGRFVEAQGLKVAVTDEPSGEARTLSGYSVQDAAISPDGRLVATAGIDGVVRLFEASTGQEIRRFTDSSSYRIYDLAFSPDGSRLAAAGGSTYIWDVNSSAAPKLITQTDALKQPYGRKNWQPGLRGFSRCVAWSADGQKIAVGYEARGIGVYDAVSGKLEHRFVGHKNWVLSLAFRPDGKQLASAGDTSVRLWDLEHDQALPSRPFHTALVRSVAYSPDGRFLASASLDGTVAVRDAQTGQAVRQIRPGRGTATSVAFGPDSKVFAIGSSDGEVSLWDASSGRRTDTLAGPSGVVLRVAFAGSLAIAASRDNAVRVWEVQR